MVRLALRTCPLTERNRGGQIARFLEEEEEEESDDPCGSKPGHEATASQVGTQRNAPS